MFVSRPVLLLVVAVALAAALWSARPTNGAGRESPEPTYVVKPGDTLWVIAESRYGGDPREAIWRIKRRNGLVTSTLTPGTVLALPRS